MRTRSWTWLAALVGTILPGVLAAQDGQGTLTYKLEGREVPRYYLVKHYFSSAYGACVIEPDLCGPFLESNGLSIDSRDTLLEAVRRAHELEFGKAGPRLYLDDAAGRRIEMGRGSDVPHPETFATEEEYMGRVAEVEDRKARALADIYAGLQESLLREGASTAGIERYIDDRIAPTTRAASDEPFDAGNAIWRISAEFEARLKELTRNLPEAD